MAAMVSADAVLFDAYGTLLDLAGAVADEAAALGELAPVLAELWRRKQLEYSWLRSLMGRHADFAQVTAEALDHGLEALGLAEPALRTRLLAAHGRLHCYPEVPAVLAALRRHGLRTAVLSNGSPAMLAGDLAAAGIDGLLDAVYSVEAVGRFKPSPEVYRHAAHELGLAPDRVAFLSSNGWDVHGAASFGFTTIWVNRTAAAPERLPGAPIRTLASLAPLPALLGCG